MNSWKNHEQQLNDCIEYFKGNKIWTVIFEGFRQKYLSYGRFSGTVVVENLSAEDIDELEGFFSQNYHGKKSASISTEKFSKALSQSRFRDVSPSEVLNGFFGKHLMGKADIRALREEQIRLIENEFSEDFSGTVAAFFLNEFEGIIKNALKINIYNCKEDDIEVWKNMLWLSGKIYNALPYRSETKCYLPVFAAGITGNPHDFDIGSTNGNLLYHIIQFDLRQRKIDVITKEGFPAYKRQKSYMLVGIMIDDISNYAVLYNAQGIKKNGEVHKGLEGFCREKNIVQVPLNVLSELERIECINNEIIVVENPSVLTVFCDDVSCMCTNGQPKLAGLMVLELVEKSGTDVFYFGDLDPEGLLIAQKLSYFYKGKFNYLHMSENDYIVSMSGEELSERRLKILDKISDPELEGVAGKMREYKMAGYQENIIVSMGKI